MIRTPFKLAVALVTGLVLSGCGLSLQNAPVGRDVEGESYTIVGEFTDVAGLPIGGKVRLGPATVGRIYSLDTKDFVAYVTMKIRSDVQLPKNTRAELEMSTALGDQFIALKLPKGAGGAMLRDGGRIPLANTHRGVEIEDNMALLGNVLNNSGIDQARTIVTELNTMLDGREDQARALLKRADDVLAALDKRTDEFNRTLRAVNTLGKTVTENEALLAQALTEIRPAIDVLRDQQGNFDNLLDGVRILSTDVGVAMKKTKSQLVNTLVKIGPILDELSSVDRDLGVIVAKFPRFAALVQRAIPGDYMNLNGIINVPDSLIGAIAPGGGSSGGGSARSGPVDGERAVERLLRGGVG